MIVVWIARILGWLCAHLPEPCARAFCAFVGDVIYFLPSKRRWYGLSNLHHAFPDKPAEWRHKITREASRRLIEMALYDLSAPYFDLKRIDQIVTIPQETIDRIERMKVDYDGKGGVMLIPHFTLFEALTVAPGIFEGMPEFGAVFRPFDNKHLNEFIKQTRARFGVTLFSRKEGFARALDMIRRGGWVGVLFDQNAGLSGALITLFDRVAAATDLPGLMSKKFDAPVIVTYMKRTGFWRCELHCEVLETEREPMAVTLASNRWLENYLRTSDDACADWLWTHKRWKCQEEPDRRFRLMQKKIWLEESAQSAGQTSIPKRTRYWMRLPNWLGDVVMAIPLIRAVRKARPDCEIVLLGQSHFMPLLEQLDVADRLIALPKKDDPGYYAHFKPYREEYPDCYVLFTNSLRGDREAQLTDCHQRFGMLRPGKKRPLLTHYWEVPADLDERTIHQSLVWEKFLRHFGLLEPLERSPLALTENAPAKTGHVFGMICGTENDPSKRWPVERWRELIELVKTQQPGARIRLFGTARDAEITAQVKDGLAAELVEDLAGKTNLVEFAQSLGECAAIVCNDTGGMHLANMLGVPVVGVYGPTNPVRTGPFFEAPVAIVQPEGCPATGGMDIAQVSAEQAARSLQQLLTA